MLIELLVIPHCPHQGAAEKLFHDAIAAVGLTEPVRTVAIETEQEARARTFAGSPRSISTVSTCCPRLELSPRWPAGSMRTPVAT